MGCETMHWIRAECTRPQSGNTTRRIIGLPKTGPSHAPAELRPFFIVTFGNTLLNATAIRRKRGPSLSRRIGQTGNVFQHGHTKEWNPAAQAYGRYWIDTPERRKRRTVTLGICPSRSLARRKLREHIEREGINGKEAFTTNTTPATTFRAHAAKWIASLGTRQRKPVKPATICGWQHSLDKWILPNLGDKLLADVSNGALRELVKQMVAAGLSPQTIVTHSRVVKMVVASAVDSDGDQLYPRKWNHDFIGLPIIRKELQRRPTLTEAEVMEVLASAKQQRYAMLFALLAGTGLRIGEALAVKSTDLVIRLPRASRTA